MKNVGLLLLTVLGFMVAHSQKIQYSRQTIKAPLADATQLVSNIAGNHHLLFFTSGKKPKLYIFNKQLQLVSEKELDDKLQQNAEVRIIPFRNYYYLYSHVMGTKSHRIIKIDGEGEAIDLSASLIRLMDSARINHASTLQFVNKKNTLFVVSHSYFETLKQITTIISETTPDLDLKQMNAMVFPFDRLTENFQQSILTNNNLIVLKSHRDAEMGSVLEVVKFNLNSSEVLLNSFSSPMHLYVNPGIRYSERDSTMLVYSLLREPIGSMRPQRTVFITKLNDSLQPTTPLGLLKNQFRNNVGYNFLFLDGVHPHWFTFANNQQIRRLNNRPGGLSYLGDNTLSNTDLSRYRDTYLDYPIYYAQPTSVRLTLLDEKLTLKKDSLVINERSFYDLQPRPSAQFSVNDKTYLVLIQNFSSNKRGLVLLHANNGGALDATPLPVYDRYEYNLALLQPGNDYFILPYNNKRETGLLKITMTN